MTYDRSMPPRPKPAKLRLLQGARLRDVNQHEPIAPDILPVCPDDEPDDVREIFEYTLRHLDLMGLASAADRDQLLAYCWAVVNHRNASRVLAKSPILVVGMGGALVKNPALTVQTEAARTMLSFAREFALSPSARAGIETKDGAGSDDENPFADQG